MRSRAPLPADSGRGPGNGDSAEISTIPTPGTHPGESLRVHVDRPAGFIALAAKHGTKACRAKGRGEVGCPPAAQCPRALREHGNIAVHLHARAVTRPACTGFTPIRLQHEAFPSEADRKCAGG